MSPTDFEMPQKGTLLPEGSAPFVGSAQSGNFKLARRSGYLEGLADFIRVTYEEKLKTHFFLTDDEIDMVFRLMAERKTQER